jgi:cytochrome c peroxidase
MPSEMRLEPLPRLAPDPPDNPRSAGKVALGRLLFFDPVLSATQSVACATCHHPGFGWADGRATSIGVGGVGLGPDRKLGAQSTHPVLQRNAPAIVNTAFNGLVAGGRLDPVSAPMFWDSRSSGLEAQVSVPIRSLEEMRGDGCPEQEAVASAVNRVRGIERYRTLFQRAFPGNDEGPVTAAHLMKAVAAFERSLVAADSPFDRFLRGDEKALGEEQRQGLTVFQEAGCIQCHGGPMLSDFKLHFIGVPDATAGGRREFRTPTLRQLRHTAPYMHNGSQRNLEDVLVFYEQVGDAAAEAIDGAGPNEQPPLDPLLKKLNLRPEDFPALTAFLDSLNDGHYDQTVPENVPSGLPVAGIGKPSLKPAR